MKRRPGLSRYRERRSPIASTQPLTAASFGRPGLVVSTPIPTPARRQRFSLYAAAEDGVVRCYKADTTVSWSPDASDGLARAWAAASEDIRASGPAR